MRVPCPRIQPSTRVALIAAIVLGCGGEPPTGPGRGGRRPRWRSRVARSFQSGLSRECHHKSHRHGPKPAPAAHRVALTDQ
jgi:hypothetical protein